MISLTALWFLKLLSVSWVIQCVSGPLVGPQDEKKQRLEVFIKNKYPVKVNVKVSEGTFITAFGRYGNYYDRSREIHDTFTKKTTPYYKDDNKVLSVDEFKAIAVGKLITFRKTLWAWIFNFNGTPENVTDNVTSSSSSNKDKDNSSSSSSNNKDKDNSSGSSNNNENSSSSSSISSSSLREEPLKESVIETAKLENLLSETVVLRLQKNPSEPESSHGLVLFLDLDDTVTVNVFEKRINNINEIMEFNVPMLEPKQNHKMFYIRDKKFVLTIRPGVEEFLEEMSKIANNVLYTRANGMYADLVLELLNLEKYFKGRLYRDQCLFIEPGNKVKMCKDMVGRGGNINRMLLIDDSKDNACQGQEGNIIVIPTYQNEVKKPNKPFLFSALIPAFTKLVTRLKDNPKLNVQDATGEIKEIINNYTMSA